MLPYDPVVSGWHKSRGLRAPGVVPDHASMSIKAPSAMQMSLSVVTPRNRRHFWRIKSAVMCYFVDLK